MALAQQISTITCSQVEFGIDNADYFTIYAFEADSTIGVGYSEKKYYVWFDIASGATDPSPSGYDGGIEVNVAAEDSANTVANNLGVAITNNANWSVSVASNIVTVTNAKAGNTQNITDFNTGFTFATTTEGTGALSSNIKYPENQALYFIEGDKLALLSKVDADGDTRTTARKQWKAISESLVNGLMIQYYAEPDSVTSLTSTLDIDNALHLAIVDYVKSKLYYDKAGTAKDPNVIQSTMLIASVYDKKFNEAVRRFGVRKKDKVGGTRMVKVPNLI
tara:strand:- start:1155 stop:1988 length:834 start_codon:yes stop_codon:yes gene_type:complete